MAGVRRRCLLVLDHAQALADVLEVLVLVVEDDILIALVAVAALLVEV